MPTPPASPAPAQTNERPLFGIALMVIATLFLSAADVASKYLVGSMPAPLVTWLRYLVFAALMLGITLRPGGPGLPMRRPKLHVVRGLVAVASSAIFVASLGYLPIADATATSFVAPLFVTALSIPLLGEQVGWRRWTATAVGLFGVLIVVRPTGSGFSAYSLLPILSAFTWAFVLIVTRTMSATEAPLTTLATTAIFGCIPLTLALPLYWQPLSGETIAIGLFIGSVSTFGHWLILIAFRHAGASLLAPFSYAQLLWAGIFGFLLFAVVPDRWTLVGAAIIAASGLYTVHRERVRHRQRG